MQIAVEKTTKTQDEVLKGGEGQHLIIDQFTFDDVNKAKHFFVEAQGKYGKAEKQDYISLEQGSAAYSTDTVEENGESITYTYYLNGFEGDLLKMIKSDITAGVRISFRDRKAGIDYNKVAESDAKALESVLKKLQAYLLSGKKDLKTLEVYRSQMMDMALDLNEVISNLEKESGDGLAGLGAGASRNRVGLNKKAASECIFCDFVAENPMELTLHENEKHRGQRRMPMPKGWSFLGKLPNEFPDTRFEGARKWPQDEEEDY